MDKGGCSRIDLRELLLDEEFGVDDRRFIREIQSKNAAGSKTKAVTDDRRAL
jgi:hypothetical protein